MSAEALRARVHGVTAATPPSKKKFEEEKVGRDKDPGQEGQFAPKEEWDESSVKGFDPNYESEAKRKKAPKTDEQKKQDRFLKWLNDQPQETKDFFNWLSKASPEEKAFIEKVRSGKLNKDGTMREWRGGRARIAERRESEAEAARKAKATAPATRPATPADMAEMSTTNTPPADGKVFLEWLDKQPQKTKDFFNAYGKASPEERAAIDKVAQDGAALAKEQFGDAVNANKVEALKIARAQGWAMQEFEDGSAIILTPWGQRININDEENPRVAAAWNPTARYAAVARGEALPDGSFPIRTLADVAKARAALPLLAGAARRQAAQVHIEKRVIALTAGMWDESLHPRGRDGMWIDKGGFVTGLFDWFRSEKLGPQGRPGPEAQPLGKRQEARVQVLGFTMVDGEPHVAVRRSDVDDYQVGYAPAATVMQVAPPKGTLADQPEQLSLSDAPLGGNKEMPQVDTEFANSPDDLYEGLYQDDMADEIDAEGDATADEPEDPDQMGTEFKEMGVGKEALATWDVDPKLLDKLSDEDANTIWEQLNREPARADDLGIGPEEMYRRRARELVTNHLIKAQMDGGSEGGETKLGMPADFLNREGAQVDRQQSIAAQEWERINAEEDTDAVNPFTSNRAAEAAKREAGAQAFTVDDLSETELADYKKIIPAHQADYLRMRGRGQTHSTAMMGLKQRQTLWERVHGTPA